MAQTRQRRRRPAKRRAQGPKRGPSRTPTSATGRASGPDADGGNPVTSQVMDGGCYSSKQIGAAMIIVGFPKDAQVIADGMATVRAETGGCGGGGCRVGNGCTTGDAARASSVCCWGPWALNKANGGNSANERCAAELICSTQEAKRIWEGAGQCFGCLEGPNPWEAATTGTAADKKMAQQLIALDAKDHNALIGIVGADPIKGTALEQAVGSAVDAVTAPFDALKAIVAFIARLFEPSFWLRVGKVILGAIALIIGTSILARAMLGVDIGLGERLSGGARRAWAAGDPGEPPSAAERSRGRRQVDKVLADNPQYQRPLGGEEPPF